MNEELKNNLWQKSFYKRSIALLVVITIAAIINFAFSFSHEYWLLLTAFMVMQVSIGAPLRQGISIALMIVVGVVFAAMLNTLPINSVNTILVLIFIAAAYLSLRFFNQPFNPLTVFLIAFYLAVFTPAIDNNFLENRFIDVALGGIIGMLGAHFIYPAKLGEEFRRGLLPVLAALINYSSAMKAAFLNQDKVWLINARLNVETNLQTKPYPEWAYELGFNPGLRGGFRFFLLNIERIADVLFAMGYHATHPIDASLLSPLAPLFNECMDKNQLLLQVLYDYFQSDKLEDVSEDFTTDITNLEKAVSKVIPNSLELLDIDPDYVAMTAFTRDIKDMRNILLQLVMALIKGKSTGASNG